MRSWGRIPLLLVGFWFSHLLLVSAEVVSGVVKSRSEGWGFMGKFVFDWAEHPVPNPIPAAGQECGTQPSGALPGQDDLGLVHIHLWWRSDPATMAEFGRGLRVLLYDDQPDSFPAVYGKHDSVGSMPCAERARPLAYDVILGQRTGHVPCDGIINVVWLEDEDFESAELVDNNDVYAASYRTFPFRLPTLGCLFGEPKPCHGVYMTSDAACVGGAVTGSRKSLVTRTSSPPTGFCSRGPSSST
jgi:hypothetical protein